MGKGKGKGDEHVCRVNYLFQASQHLSNHLPPLGRYYGKVLTVVTEKTSAKKDFTLKRSMCKECRAVLTVGVNATYRVRKNKHRKGAPFMVIGCNECGLRKRIPTRKGYRLHAETNGTVSGTGYTPRTGQTLFGKSDNDSGPSPDPVSNSSEHEQKGKEHSQPSLPAPASNVQQMDVDKPPDKTHALETV